MATLDIARRARHAAQELAAISGDDRNHALSLVRKRLLADRELLLESNRIDRSAAPSVQRLDLSGAKFDTLLQGLDDVISLGDPVNRVTMSRELDDGLDLYRVTCPIGVLCVIFESRPDAAVQIASLAIKSSNAVILKGGKEALESNKMIVKILREALAESRIPPDAVQLVESREDIAELLKHDSYIDLVIPRGSKALVEHIMHSTRIPVMGHADGVCSVYIDKDADVEKAVRIAFDAKTQYPSVCNAAETLLVHEAVLSTILPRIGEKLRSKDVKLHADTACLPFLPAELTVPAVDDDFRSEFLTYEMAVKSVKSLQEAILHINSHGSHHTDAIVTENAAAAEQFMAGVDSAGVFHNASTRFADGFRYGFGAEVGVSTHRVHARGPVGVEGLLIYKYRLYGKGHVVEDYGAGKRSYTHRELDAKSLPKL